MAENVRVENGQLYAGNQQLMGGALTTQLTTITHTSPTADYAIQDLTQTTPWGFADHHEGNTELKVVANLQIRLAELEPALKAAGLLT